MSLLNCKSGRRETCLPIMSSANHAYLGRTVKQFFPAVDGHKSGKLVRYNRGLMSLLTYLQNSRSSVPEDIEDVDVCHEIFMVMYFDWCFDIIRLDISDASRPNIQRQTPLSE